MNSLNTLRNGYKNLTVLSSAEAELMKGGAYRRKNSESNNGNVCFRTLRGETTLTMISLTDCVLTRKSGVKNHF